MYCVWRTYLEGTVQVTQSRISACENYKVQVADPAKTVRLQKEQQLRKVIPLRPTPPLGFLSTLLLTGSDSDKKADTLKQESVRMTMYRKLSCFCVVLSVSTS